MASYAVAMSAPASGPRLCPNCVAVATHAFCPKCGQPTQGLRAGLRELIHDFAGATLGADARIWVSLRELFRRPGALTVAYAEGRRFRYLSPLRMYLFASILMFTMTALFSSDTSSVSFALPDNAEFLAVPAERQDGVETFLTENILTGNGWFQHTFGDYLRNWAHHMDSMSGEERDRAIKTQIANLAPTALFFFLPFLAAILRLVWVRRDFLYFDHFVFSLHFMSFLYLMVSALKVLPLPTFVIVWIALIYPPFYFVRAQQRITGLRPRRVLAAGVLTFLLAIPVALGLSICFILIGALTA